MIRELYENIINNNEVRKNLIELKKEIKDENNRRALAYMLGKDYSVFYGLLTSEDPKVRKNTVLIMGELGDNEFLQPLFKAYQEEVQMFVKSAYLAAISFLNYLELVPELKSLLENLTHEEYEESNKKHIEEQIRVLNNMLLMVEPPKTHKFTGYHILSDLILITNRNHKDVTRKQIKNGKHKEMNAGVYVKTDDLNEILSIRTYSEILFMLPGVNAIAANPSAISEALLKANLLDFILLRHKGEAPFYFRIEIKSKIELDKKSILAKRIAAEIERGTDRKLINSTSNYEFEIRLIENKDGLYNTLIKLNTLKDKRFEYRKNTIAASIHPVNAALVANLAKDYLMEDGQILDPFCGVGTMLIERNKLVRANPIYGLDIYGDAIEKARENAKSDHTVINYINRDFFDFRHEYEFDEIITNLSMKGSRKYEKDLESLYIKFFQQAGTVLKEDGKIILYSNEPTYVRNYLRNNPNYKLMKEFEINKKEGTYLFIINYRTF
ncbi:putative RNA methylase family UPF0020 [Mobilisporobacter senegalensis]|uniref:Putative RNA methylase family UPF0020 n=1 Tax=Mobilisporobacter senegalensis TaxID=1329262 RepID=A0A3N1XWY3_9FIRM|nr:methyltransferase domain-containing protein [Mobilisporobacter senegalensis]ROR29437.1 putative RNA methylase family UPF0020 [Mobilisporobacter senegalensis]